jgi:hypothetical protein
MSARDDAERVFMKPAGPEEQPLEKPDLPQVRAARERDRAARARVAAGLDFKPTEAELLAQRSSPKRGWR